MYGFLLLLLLIFVSALPALAVHIWFRLSRYPMKLPWLLLSMLAGALSVLLAILLQSCFPDLPVTGIGTVLFRLFVQIALTEEAARLLMVFLLLEFGRRFPGRQEGGSRNFGEDWVQFPVSPSLGTATGLLAGLGFALVETALFSASDFTVALLRAFTAAPLHGACGGRVGYAAASLREKPSGGIARFISAVLLHGLYDFMLINPAIPSFLPVLLALVSLFSSIQVIRARIFNHKGE
ncbi:hypothetical protein FACS1894151_05690 [Spirochaetia bacterium]|nr:hypothetical protein FACS1894151_05690 [Spirochaetia bacterium]